MEAVFIGIGAFIGWFFVSIFVGKKLMQSKGIASLGWFLLWILTFSFFFSSSSSSTSNSNANYGECDDDTENNCFLWDDDCDNSWDTDGDGD